MDSRLILDDSPRVTRFVESRLSGASFTSHVAIGLERNGELVAGVIYDAFTGANCNMHIAALPGRRWMTRQYLYAVFNYPFVQLDLRRVTGPVEATNTQALRFDLHLGFEHEATLHGAALSGDIYLLVLWRHRCRYWNGASAMRKAA